MWLRFKIFFCYAALLLLLVFIISLFRQEQTRRNGLYRESKEMLSAHQLAEKSYVNLLDLFLTAETAVTWEYENWEEYGRKRKNVCDSLRLLKKYVHSPEQQERIDSLCLLLENKEQLLFTAMRNLQEWQNIADIVGERIPVVLSEVRKQSQGQAIPLKMEISDPDGTVSRKRNFWDIFRRKEKKSAYLQQKEQMERKQEQQTASSPVVTARRMLLTLNDRVIEEQERRQAYLSVQMDSLYRNNAELNRKMNALVTEFEKETNARFTSKYEAFILDRDTSYRTVAGLALGVSLLTIVFYAIIHRDINRKYRYQKELETSDRKNRELLQSKKDMMLAIAHDLRSPLGSLKMMNNAILMMVDKERVGDEVYEMIQMMNKTSEEIFLLLDNLLKWAKNRLNKQHVYKQQTDINSIIDSTAEMYIPMAAQKGVKIILENLDKELVGLVDIDMLKTIIRNLISNAMKFSFEGGTITLSSRSEGDFVTVSVKDTGKGIKKEDQDKLLKQDSHFTTYGTKNEKGSGLGLMLCKDFVELHGGKLWFESEGEGKGTTFLFSMKALNQEA